MLSREERIFSELLLARGLVARDFIEEFAKKKASQGPSGPSLAEVLIDSGEIERSRAEEALEEARAIDATLAPHMAGGARLGEFRLLREIGRGGMGIVYEAEQESLGRRVALKVLPAGAALDERLAIRFLREARAAARLQHPGIVPVFASGRADGVLFFAMELVEGRSLAQVVTEEGALAPERAACLVAEIGRALQHAHDADLIHRDVKPENILLASDGRARLTDFGLVHESFTSSFTLPHHVLGTPAYMAPEQALGRAVDRRSDVYSLGAVLYTLVGGNAPYAGDVPSTVLSRVLSGPPPPLLSQRAGIPPGLAAICERAMARKPEDRYATAALLAEDLEAFGRGEAIVSAAPRARSRRTGWLLGAAAVLAAAALVIAIVKHEGSKSPVEVGPVPFAAITTMFDRSASPPPNAFTSDPFQAEVGVKFQADSCGYVTGIRFFKDERSGGSHVGHLWTNAGALLATAVFSGESTKGWQEASFTMPVRIAPNTTYVASYHIGANQGYVDQRAGFSAAGLDRPPLHALKSGVDDCNGVAKAGPPRDTGGFPDQCTQSNYFVDVAFRQVDCGSNTDPTFVLASATAGSKGWPALSPDAKLLAYSVCTSGRCDTRLQELATGEIVKLAAARFWPAFAPDGRSIAFATDTGVDILEFDGRTVDERTLRHLAASFSPGRPTWSRNGAEIIFGERDVSKVGSSSAGMWVGDVASRRVRLRTRMDARDFSYSPHGLRIAFVSRASGAPHVWTIAPERGDAIRLTSDSAAEWSPFWSPDGRRLYFGSERGGAPGMWSVDVEEASGRPIASPSPALRVVFPATFYATLSAAGGQIAIASEANPGRIFRFPFDPVSGALTAPPVALPPFPGGAATPQISPDQTVLAAVLQKKLAIVPADGSGEPRLLTDDEFASVAPRWSPDGKTIAFCSNRSGRMEVWTIRADGSELRRITTTPDGDACYPVWSPDGARLAYTVQGRGAYLIAAQTPNASPEALPSYGAQELLEPWSWSPDGETLAAWGDSGVVLYSIRDRRFLRITDFGGHPVWLGDGRHLLFVGDRKIFMVDRDGGEPREIYAAAPAALPPFLSVAADGRAIYTSLTAPNDEAIWVASFPP